MTVFSAKSYHVLAYFILSTIFVLYAGVDLGRPPVDLHQFRQTQTLSTIYNFYINEVNIFYPELDTNGSQSGIILEFPLFQAISAIFMKIIGYYEFVPRIINLIFGLVAAYATAKFIDENYFHGCALPVFSFCLFTPSMLFLSSAILVDISATAFATLSVLLFFRSRSQETIFQTDYYLSIILGIFAMLIKPTAALPVYTIALICFVFFEHSPSWTRKFRLALLYITPQFFFLAVWMLYARHVNSENPHVYTNFSISWFFGTLEQRGSFEVWAEFFERFLYNGLGFVSGGLTLLAIAASNAKSSIFKALIAISVSCFLYLLVFINLNYVHTYYQFPVFLLTSALGGLSFWILISRFIICERLKSLAVWIFTIVIAVASNIVVTRHWVDVAAVASPYEKNMCEYHLGTQVRDLIDSFGVKPELLAVHHGGGRDCWNGPHAIMYYLRSRGYVLRDGNFAMPAEDGVQLFVDISQAPFAADVAGWRHVYSERLQGAVRDFFVYFYLPDHEYPLANTLFLEVPDGEILSSGVEFEILMTFFDLEIPPLSNVRLRASLQTVPGNIEVFFLLRTYSGGYAFDSLREFRLNDQETQLNFDTGMFADYVLHIGSHEEGIIKFNGPVELTYQPIFSNSSR